MDGDTKPITKTCSKCGSEKEADKFLKNVLYVSFAKMKGERKNTN